MSTYFVVILYNIIKLPTFIVTLFNFIRSLTFIIIIFSKRLWVMINFIFLRLMGPSPKIYKKFYKFKPKTLLAKFDIFKFLKKEEIKHVDVAEHTYLDYPIKLDKYNKPKILSSSHYALFNVEEAISTNLEPFFRRYQYITKRRFWKNLYYRFYQDNFFPINLKPFIDRPGSKMWYSEKYRNNEWKFVLFANEFILALDELWELDHGCARHSWTIDRHPQTLSILLENVLTEEERLEEFAKHLYILSNKSYFYVNRPIIEPNEF